MSDRAILCVAMVPELHQVDFPHFDQRLPVSLGNHVPASEESESVVHKVEQVGGQRVCVGVMLTAAFPGAEPRV